MLGISSTWDGNLEAQQLTGAVVRATDRYSRRSGRNIPMKAAPLAFLPQRDRHDEHRDRDNFKSRKRPLVAHMLPQHELHRIGWRGDENSELVREPGDEPARFVRRKLAQMDWDHSPCALHPGLHQKRTNGQYSERR